MNGSTSPLPISQDFIELCYRFSQLVNPCMHLQRSLQQSLPSLRFWCLGIPWWRCSFVGFPDFSGWQFSSYSMFLGALILGWWSWGLPGSCVLPAERARPCLLRSDYDTVKVYNRKITIDTWHPWHPSALMHWENHQTREFNSIDKGLSRNGWSCKLVNTL